jgi:ribonuclease PH
LQADGGTRTASITGGMIALIDAINSIKKDLPNPKVYPLRDSLAAISVGIVDGKPVSDLDYPMDFAAAVDMNVVMTGKGQFVEIQGTGEEATFSESELGKLLKLAKAGIKELTGIQKSAIGAKWPKF